MSFKILFLFLTLLISAQSQKYDQNSIIDILKSFLQKNVPNEIVLNFFEYLKTLQKKEYPTHLSENRKGFKNHLSTIKANNGYIEDQRNYKDMSYGDYTLSYNGCELIAIYNALYELTKKNDTDFAQIIDIHEKNGILINGVFGTSMKTIEQYFIKNGFPTKSSSIKDDYEQIAKNSDVLILTIYNNKDDIMAQIHTIAITKKNGKYFVHNNSANPPSVGYTSFANALNSINSGKAKDLFLIGINKK